MFNNNDIAILGGRFGAGITPGNKPQDRTIGSPAFFAAQLGIVKICIHWTLDFGIQAAAGKQRQEAHQDSSLLYHRIAVIRD